MQRISLVNTAHNFIRDVLHPGDIAIDATVGNGHDTLFLAEQVSPSGRVFGFDIQQAAIDSTRAKASTRCKMLAENMTLIHASHANMAEKIPYNIMATSARSCLIWVICRVATKSIITHTDSTITALNIANRILSSNGIITVLAYPGHQGGGVETEQVKSWCKQLDEDQFKISIVYSSENKESAPRLFVIRKMN